MVRQSRLRRGIVLADDSLFHRSQRGQIEGAFITQEDADNSLLSMDGGDHRDPGLDGELSILQLEMSLEGLVLFVDWQTGHHLEPGDHARKILQCEDLMRLQQAIHPQ